MKTLHNRSWLFSNCLFIFLSLYLFMKFVFIFFFSAAYEPKLMFESTPFYLLLGVNNTQLMFLSLVVTFSDLYLHLRSGRRHLLLSFIPTSIMLSGIGISIMTNQMDVTYVYHYGLFGCLLLVVLIDYHYVLTGKEYPMTLRKKEQILRNGIEVRGKLLFAKKSQTSQQSSVHMQSGSSFELKEVTDGIIQKMQTSLENLERKTERIEALENTIEEGWKNLVNHERVFTERIIYCLESLEKIPFHEKNLGRAPSVADKRYANEKMQNPSLVDQTGDIVVIVKRGIIKEISDSFTNFLGYGKSELIQKNFFILITPQGLEDARNFYLNRLKGASLNSFRTFLLSKQQTELLVTITMTPTMYNGDTAEFLHILALQDSSLYPILMMND